MKKKLVKKTDSMPLFQLYNNECTVRQNSTLGNCVCNSLSQCGGSGADGIIQCALLGLVSCKK